jgi:hypothetical protein
MTTLNSSTKRAFTAAAKAFAATPSATNWQRLEAAMYALQELTHTVANVQAPTK